MFNRAKMVAKMVAKMWYYFMDLQSVDPGSIPVIIHMSHWWLQKEQYCNFFIITPVVFLCCQMISWLLLMS